MSNPGPEDFNVLIGSDADLMGQARTLSKELFTTETTLTVHREIWNVNTNEMISDAELEPTDCILDEPSLDNGWSQDSVGWNFFDSVALDVAGWIEIRYIFTDTAGKRTPKVYSGTVRNYNP